MDEDRRHRVDPLEGSAGHRRHGDVHAAGTAGGGTAVGGLAGGNQGNGDPIVIDLDDATGSGNFDIDDDRADDRTPTSGFTGCAVGGTPANNLRRVTSPTSPSPQYPAPPEPLEPLRAPCLCVSMPNSPSRSLITYQ